MFIILQDFKKCGIPIELLQLQTMGIKDNTIGIYVWQIRWGI
jgi:hypothetical protein